MKLFVLLLLFLPTVYAIEVPLVLTIDGSIPIETAELPIEELYEETMIEETSEVPITGAVAYEEPEPGKKWILWLLLGVAASVAVILVLRR